MAQRRMFSKTITNSSSFIMMPPTSQLLYIHLCMNADDDGFVEHFPIMRMVEAKPDDLKVLHGKSFVQIFDDKVLIINDWKENNYIRNDRYSPSKYLKIYKEELKLLSEKESGIPNDNQMAPTLATQVRLGKVRLGKVKDTDETSSSEIPELIKSFEKINPASKKFYGNTVQRLACQQLIDTYGFDKVKNVIENTLSKTNKMSYMPIITTPLKLYEKWSNLENAIHQLKNKSEKRIIV